MNDLSRETENTAGGIADAAKGINDIAKLGNGINSQGNANNANNANKGPKENNNNKKPSNEKGNNKSSDKGAKDKNTNTAPKGNSPSTKGASEAGSKAAESAAAKTAGAAAEGGSAGGPAGAIAAAGAAAAKQATNKNGFSFLLGIVILLLAPSIIIIAIVIGAPGAIWNEVFHTDAQISPPASMEEELKKGQSDLIEKQQEYLDIVATASDNAYDKVYKDLKAKCIREGIDYTLSMQNVHDNASSYEYVDEPQEEIKEEEKKEEKSPEEEKKDSKKQSKKEKSVIKKNLAKKGKKKNEATIYVFLRQHGFSEAATAGIMGCWVRESGLNPSSINKEEQRRKGDTWCGIGLAQWTDGRNRALRSYAKKKGGKWNDLDIQLSFFIYEIKTSRKSINSSKFKKMKNVREATAYFLDIYEYGGASKKPEWMRPRYASAKSIYKRYTGENVNDIELDFDVDGDDSSYNLVSIISAFSVAEDQLLYNNERERIKREEKHVENLSKYFTNGEYLSYLTEIVGYAFKKHVYYPAVDGAYDQILQVKLWAKLKSDSFKDNFLIVTYGDIKETTKSGMKNNNKIKKKYYDSIDIEYAPIEQIMENVFELKPTAICKNSDGEIIGSSASTNLDVVETLTQDNIALLYNAESGEYEGIAPTRFMNPLGNQRFKSTSHSMSWRTCPIHGHEFHKGWDMAIREGASIYAVEDGKVEVARSDRYGLGKHVVLKHGGKIRTVYAHMSKILVHQGQKVKKGQKIGLVGSTGASTGAHLHFEVKEGKKNIEAEKWIKKH